MADADLIADGKRHGIVITDYLIERIRYGKLTPEVAVDIVAINVEKHANEMLLDGRSRQEVAAWIQAARSVFRERMIAALGPKQ